MYKTNYFTISVPKNDGHPMLQTKSIQETYRDPKEKQISHLFDLCRQLVSSCHDITEPICIQLDTRNHVMTNTDPGYTLGISDTHVTCMITIYPMNNADIRCECKTSIARTCVTSSAPDPGYFVREYSDSVTAKNAEYIQKQVQDNIERMMNELKFSE